MCIYNSIYHRIKINNSNPPFIFISFSRYLSFLMESYFHHMYCIFRGCFSRHYKLTTLILQLMLTLLTYHYTIAPNRVLKKNKTPSWTFIRRCNFIICLDKIQDIIVINILKNNFILSRCNTFISTLAPRGNLEPQL